MENVGTVSLKLAFDSKSLDKDVSSTDKKLQKLGDSTNGVSDKLKNGLATAGKVALGAIAAGAAAATGAVVALGKSALDSYANYEQLTGGVETLFGAGGKSLEEYAKSVGKSTEQVKSKYDNLILAQTNVENSANNAYKTAGMSANQYMETVTSFSASLIGSLNGDTVKASKYADQAITDMSDNANKMGTNMESVETAYQGFAKGQFMLLDNLKLGYGGTKEEMQRLLENASKISGIKYDISSYADITQAIHVIQTQMGITGTTAAEASTTIQGSVGAMKAAWSNLVTGMADNNADIDKLISNFVDSIGTVAENIIPRLQIILQKIPELIIKLAPLLIAQLPVLISTLLPAVITAVTTIFTSIMNILPQLISTIMTAIINALPMMITAIVNAIPLFLQAVFEIAMAVVNALPVILEQLVAALPMLITGIINFFIDPGNINQLLIGAVRLFMALVMAIPQIIQALGQAIPQIVQAVFKMLISPSFWKTLLKGVAMMLASLFIGIVNLLVAGLNNLISGVTLGAVKNAIPSIPSGTVNGWFAMAQGGLATGATPAIVGEAGTEAVLPLQRNTDNWSGLLANTLVDEMEKQGNTSGGITVNMNNYINNEMDADEIGRRMMTSIRRATA